MIDAKIATPYTIINFTTFLQKNKYFEESFRIFEILEEFFNINQYRIILYIFF